MSAALAYHFDDDVPHGPANDNTPILSATVIKMSTASRCGLDIHNVAARAAASFSLSFIPRINDLTARAAALQAYDGNMKRVKAVSNGKTIYNVYDAAGRLAHVDEVTDNKETDYLHGMGQTVARIQNNVFTYLIPDHLGSAQAATDRNGNVLWREHYTPFGETLNGPAANDNQSGFTGHIKDKDTGLNYMQARYYDPAIGRFLSVDPVGFMTSGYDPRYFNRYAYSGNDPINNIDPDGQFFGAAGKLIKLAVKGGDIGATFAGAAADTKTLFSGNASGLQRLGAAASLATEIFSPVSARDAKAGAGFVQKKLGGTCCFVAGTLVETEIGLRPIEEIELGDKVLARNPETGETALKSVTDLIRLNERQIWEVSLSGNNDASEFFETTDDHPWWIVDADGNGSWKDTAELSVGMIVITSDNQTMVITKVLETNRTDATYNLTVADFETYFVGENKVLVHNCQISMDDALDQADNFLNLGTDIKSHTNKNGVQFIQQGADANGQVTKRVGFDVNPSSNHVKKEGPHLNLQTQRNKSIVKNGSEADPHIPIDPSTVRPGDF